MGEQQEHVLANRQAFWEQKKGEIDGIKDRLGKGLDEGIKETVTSLQVLGINTTQSCEGHLEWGVGAPWVEVAAPESERLSRLEEQAQRTFQEAEAALETEGHITDEIATKFDEAHTLRREVKRINLVEAAKVMPLLETFYQNRQDTPFDGRLTLSFLSHGSSRIESQGAAFQETASSEIKQQKLAEYQEEMRVFTSFLKNKYFSD